MNSIKFRSFLFCLLASAAWTHAVAVNNEVARYFEDAKVLFDKGDYAGAEIQLKNVLQQNSSLLAAHVLLGRTYLRLGKGPEAEKEIKEAGKYGADRSVMVPLLAQAYLAEFKHEQMLKELDPEGLPDNARFELLMYRAQAQLELSKFPQARDSFTAAGRIDGLSLRPVIGLAMVALRAGDLDSATTLAEEALRRDPNDADALNTRASIFHTQGKLESALDYYSRALKTAPKHREARVARASILLDLNRLPEVEQDLDYLAENFPDDPRGIYLRGVVQAQKGDAAGAKESIHKVGDLLDTYVPEWIEQNQQILLLAGTTNYSLGRFEKARDYLEKYVDHNPTAVPVMRLLGASLIATKQYERAISVLSKAQSLAPTDPNILGVLATAWMEKGRYKKASALLEQAAALPNASNAVRTQQALNDLYLRQPEQALTELSAVVSKDPNDQRAGLLLAVMHQRRGESKQAVELATRLLATNPDNVTLLNLLGSAQAGTGDNAAARASFSKVLEKNPKFTPTLRNLARLDLHEGKPDQARQRLQALLKENAKDTAVLMDLARVEEAAQQPEAAIRWLEQGRGIDKDSADLQLYLGDLLLRQHLLERATRVVEEAENLVPNSLAVMDLRIRLQIAQNDPTLARATLKQMADVAGFDTGWLITIARRQVAVEAWDDALYVLSKASQGEPDRLEPRIMAFDLALARDRMTRAEEEAAAIHERWPNSVEGVQTAAELAFRRGDLTTAIAGFRRAMAIAPSTLVVTRLVLAERAAGKLQEALQDMSGWVQKHPEDLVARQAEAEIHLAQDDLPRARAAYEAILARDPEHADALNNLAFVMDRQGDKRALDYARRAQQLAPKDPDVNDTLGWVLVRNGMAEEGLSYLRDAQSRAAQSPSIRYHIAVALNALGRTDEARHEIADVLKIAGPFAERKEAEKFQQKIGR